MPHISCISKLRSRDGLETERPLGSERKFEQAEQADNMHSQNLELALRFHLWQERVVTEGKLLPIPKGKK